MTGYEWLVFFHVLAAIVWVGGATITQVMGALLEESGDGDPEYKRRLARILNVSRGELLLLVGVVFLIVAKVGA